MGSSPPVKLGIIGYGFSTKVFHLPFIVPNPDLQVYAFLQRESSLLYRVPSLPSRAEEEARLDLSPITPTRTRRASLSTDVFPRAKRYKTSEEFFADSEIEVVIVCSRDDTHAEFAEKALNSGKHVVVEKPFARSVEEADRVIALAKEKGLLVTVFQNRRWDSDFLTLKKLIGEGALGQVVDAQMHYDFESPSWIKGWTDKEYVKGSGQGMMYGLGSHSIDQTIVLFGRPKSVTGFLRSLRGVESEVEDTFTIVLQYDGKWKNLIVTVKTTVVTVLRDPIKYIIRGTGGSYIKYGTCVQEQQSMEGVSSASRGFGVEDPRLYGVLTTLDRFDDTQALEPKSQKYIGHYPTLPGRWRGFYENLADAVRGKGQLAVKAEDSRDGLRVMELARESHETGTIVPWSKGVNIE